MAERSASDPAARPVRLRLDDRRLRVLAAALLAYGILGLTSLGVIAVAGARSLDAVAPLTDSLESERRDLVAALQATATAVDDAAAGTADAGSSLEQASGSASQAAGLARSLAVTMRTVASASNVPILGGSLAGRASGFSDAALQADRLGTALDDVGAALGANDRDVGIVRTDLVALSRRLGGLAATVAAMPPLGDSDGGAGTLRLALLALVVWLAPPAAAALAGGVWLWRRLAYGAISGAEERPEQGRAAPQA